MAISRIEQQIETLPPVKQIEMLERIIHNLKQLLVSERSSTHLLKKDGTMITNKLNQIYAMKQPGLEPQLHNAQFASIDRDVW